MTENISYIPTRIKNAAKGGHVTGTEDIIDDVSGKTQKEINAAASEEIAEIKGGSTDSIATLDQKIATEQGRAQGAEQGLDNRLSTVEELAEISVGGGDIGIGTAADFESDDPSDLAKVPTIGAMLSGANDGVYDISARHNGTKYTDLAEALGTNGANVPDSLKRGGMSVKFVQSSDNKYVQYRLMKDEWSATVSDWQGVDDEPTAESDNLAKSGGVYKEIIDTAIKSSQDVGKVYFSPLSFVLGTTYNGEYVGNRDYRITTPDVQYSDRDLYIHIEDGFTVLLSFFSDQTTFSKAVEVTGVYYIRKGYFKLTVRRTVEDTSETANIEEFCKKVYYDSKLVEELNYEFRKINNVYELGNISLSSGNLSYSYSTQRCRTVEGDYVHLKAGDSILFTNDSYLLIIYKKTIGSESWTSGTVTNNRFIASEECYVVICIRTLDSTSIADINTVLANLVIKIDNTTDKILDGLSKANSIVSIDNPYWEHRMQGSVDSGDDRFIKGLFVKFDSITFYGADFKYTKTFNDAVADTGATVRDSQDYTAGCLYLDRTSQYSEALIFDFDIKKFVIINDITDYASFNYIILAYEYNGNGCGEICRQYDYKKLHNINPYKYQVNGGYLSTLREKELELLECKTSSFMMGFCSDTHNPVPEDDGAPIFVTNTVMNDIDKFIGLDAMINGGDDILFGSMVKRNGIASLNLQFNGIDLDRYLPCVGNHDYNSLGSGRHIESNKSWFITDKDLELLYFRHCKTTYREDGKLYYYRDFEVKKVRIIVLNTQDVPIEFDNNDNIPFNLDPLRLFGIRQSQIDFLVNALSLSDKTDKSDWKVAIVMHVGLYSHMEGVVNPPTEEFPAIEGQTYGYDPSKGMFSNGSLWNRVIIRSILSAFVRKTTYTYSYIDTDAEHPGMFSVSGNVDFTGEQGRLIAVFNGHTHRDCYINRDGFNCIGIQCSFSNDVAQSSEVEYSTPSMPPYTYNEFAIDVIIFDDDNEKIILKRFGKHHSVDNPVGDREYSYDVTI